ncbi:hypothetical protein Terro_1330 [Terriglobus roseus DSM 18391]|uniref:Uncharacterized protein n=1 Tax=Terriglobus roseus (strain DSM 18391 / NRRL B-41598 / KBS 63) TaxID=926566 RepID=I3ZEH1_TERRK|nr:hypothetical protein [Terriglobus roseus]AFL87639.1 hypothetical protein Terro_1330 [Terriglobus roseus DSM 18391]
MLCFSRSAIVAVLLLPVAALPAQTAPAAGPKPAPRKTLSTPLPSAAASAPKTAAPQSFPQLKPYESCSFPDGLQITNIVPMPDDVKQRPVQSHGKAGTVPLLAGRRVDFAYPGSDPYASAKIELLPEANFIANRKALFDDFDDIIASDKNVSRNTTRKSPFNAFSIAGLDRNAVDGKTLGIYLLIDDRTHVVTTVYLLNPAKTPIKTAADYARMRDTFLFNYTKCIRNNQSGVLFGNSK